MPKISSIEVEYGRSVCPKQYESQKANAKMLVAFDQDEDVDIDEALADAFDTLVIHVHTRLGIAVPETSEVAAKTKEKKPPKTAPTKRATAKKDTPVASKKDTSTESGPTHSTTSSTATKPASPSEDGLGGSDMIKAVTQKMQKLSNSGDTTAGGDDIVKLLKAYISTAPFTPSNIPEDKREEFIRELNELG